MVACQIDPKGVFGIIPCIQITVISNNVFQIRSRSDFQQSNKKREKGIIIDHLKIYLYNPFVCIVIGLFKI